MEDRFSAIWRRQPNEWYLAAGQEVSQQSKLDKKLVARVTGRHKVDDGLLIHSGFGIASVIISVLMGTLGLVLLAVIRIVEAGTPRGIARESWFVAVLGLLLILGLGMSLLGIELGITGLIHRDRKRVFPILGLVFNSAIAVVLVGIIFVGVIVF